MTFLMLFKARYWLFTNLLLMVSFLYFSGGCWRITGEDIEQVSYGCMVMAMYFALPCLVSGLIIDIFWLGRLVYKYRLDKDWKPVLIWFGVFVVWGFVYGFNFFKINS